MARWRSGNASVCKTDMHEFDSRPGLIHKETALLCGFFMYGQEIEKVVEIF